MHTFTGTSEKCTNRAQRAPFYKVKIFICTPIESTVMIVMNNMISRNQVTAKLHVTTYPRNVRALLINGHLRNTKYALNITIQCGYHGITCHSWRSKNRLSADRSAQHVHRTNEVMIVAWPRTLTNAITYRSIEVTTINVTVAPLHHTQAHTRTHSLEHLRTKESSWHHVMQHRCSVIVRHDEFLLPFLCVGDLAMNGIHHTHAVDVDLRQTII